MKKFLFAILIVLTTQSFAQKHVPYLSIGPQFSVSPKYRAASYSIEGGTWGMDSKTSLGAFLSYTPLFKLYTVGIKPYYTIQQSKKEMIMLYAAPQYVLQPGGLFVMEEGLFVGYNISKNYIGGLVLGAQHTKGVNFSPQVGINLVYLFQK